MFDSTLSGITDACTMMDHSNELDFLLQFFDNDLVDMIVLETNWYTHYVCRSFVAMPPRCRLANWTNTTRDKIYLFFCIMILMSHNKNRINDYWSKDEAYEQKIFGKLITRDRFLQKLRCLHFTDNTKAVEDDKLQKIRPVHSSFKTKFRPFQELCVYESPMK